MNKSEGAHRSCDQNFSGTYRLAKGEPALLRRELTLNTNADGIRFLDISDNIAEGSYISEAKGPEGRS